MLLAYLDELTTLATTAAEVTLQYRRATIAARRADPGAADPTDGDIERLTTEVSQFVSANSDLRLHMVASTVAVEKPAGPPPPKQSVTEEPIPAPPPQPYGVSHAGAEHLVAAWMRHMGAVDATPTQVSRDGVWTSSASVSSRR